ncbi:MAG: pseudouridine synthase [Myxococcales bacterium]|nr:pseudouridine synthase [Myxococcales bacterium]
MAQVRLQRYLAQSGVASRRKSETLIEEGRVKVNGKKVTVLGTKIDPYSDRVMVNGEAVHPEDLFYAIFNKPKGCITAVSDPEGRRTVMEFMPGMPSSVVPVGRLDFYSEGVLLMTNDGVLAAALTSSRRKVEKVYHIKIKGSIDDRELQKLRDGVKIDYRTTTKPAEVQRLKAKSRHDWLEVVLSEGKNRQLHRMLEAVGHEITKLQRVQFAGMAFHGLRVGDARELTQNELKELYDAANMKAPKGQTSRGKWVVKRETTEKARRSADRGRERITPNLTPGGSKKAKTKLLTRYREQEEDGTAPELPVPRALAEDEKTASPRRPSKARLVTGAKPKPKRGSQRAAAKPKRPSRASATRGAAKPATARSASKPKTRGAAKPGGRKNATSKPRPGKSSSARPTSSRGKTSRAKPKTRR